jgi:hypothetical protein
MIPVEQTHLMPPLGNCFDACMASILEMSLDVMPHHTGTDWILRWNDWLRPRNLCMIVTPIPDREQLHLYADHLMPGYTVLAARSPRGDWLHAVVCYDGKVVWDPHPKRDAGLGEWKEVSYLVLLDPTKPVVLGAPQEVTA